MADLVYKVLRAWSCELMTTGTFVGSPDYGLGAFTPPKQVSAGLALWLASRYAEVALLLYGPGGWGKTKYACALMAHVVGGAGFHFINKLDRVKDIQFGPGQGLVIDEQCWRDRSIDDVKGVIDLEHQRDVGCRNKDGAIPKRTPRIITTNHPRNAFWPIETFTKEHAKPVGRRILWVEIKGDLRGGGGVAAAPAEQPVKAKVVLPAAEVEEQPSKEKVVLPTAEVEEMEVATMGLYIICEELGIQKESKRRRLNEKPRQTANKRYWLAKVPTTCLQAGWVCMRRSPNGNGYVACRRGAQRVSS